MDDKYFIDKYGMTQDQLDKLKQMDDEAAKAKQSQSENSADSSDDYNDSGVTADQLRQLDDLDKKQGYDNLFKTLRNPLQSALNEKAASIDYKNDARDLAQGVVQGAVNFGDLINKGETYGVNKLFGTNFKAPDVSDVASPIGSGNQGTQANLARGLGEYLVPGGTVTKLAKPVSLLGRMIASGGAGALSGAANAPEGQKGYSALINGLIGSLIPSGFKQAEKARPSNLLRGTLSPEELQANLNAAQGTKTNLGDVIQNPTLIKSYKNQIAPSKFSGARGDMMTVHDEIQNRAQNIVKNEIGTTSPKELESEIEKTATDALKKSLGTDDLTNLEEQTNQQGDNMLSFLFGNHTKESIDNTVFNDLNDTFQGIKKEKNLRYSARDKEADNTPSFKMDATKFSKNAKEMLRDLGDTVFLKNEPKYKSFLNKVSNYTSPSETKITGIADDMGDLSQENRAMPAILGKDYPKDVGEGNGGTLIDEKVTRPTLTEATALKGMLNTIAHKNKSSPNAQDQHIGNQFSDLAKSLNEDINDSIDKSGNPKIRELHEKANKYYQDKYLPYKNKDIFPYLTGDKGADGIADDLIGGITKSQKLSRNKSLLQNPESLSGAYFIKSRGSNGIVNHEKLSSMIDSAEKQPAYKTLVDSPISRSILSLFKDFSKGTSFAKKFLSNDGSIDYDSMQKHINNLQKDPTSYKKIFPNKEGRDALDNFVNYYNKAKSYKPILIGDGKVNAAKLNNLTKDILQYPSDNAGKISGKGMPEAVKLQRLSKMNPSSDNPMFNPPTGITALDTLSSAFGIGTGAILGHAPGALLGASAPGILMRPIAKALTNETIRNRLIAQMLNKNPRIYTPNKIAATNAVAQGILNALNGKSQ